MGEKALNWGLRLLGLILFLGPFIAALAVHNWDIVAAVVPSESEIEEISGRFQGLSDRPYRDAEITDQKVVGDNLEITINLIPGLGFDLEIDEFSADLTCALETPHANLGVVRLKEPVFLKANSAEITLTVNVQRAREHFQNLHPQESPVVNLEHLSFKIYGITIYTEMRLEGISVSLW